MVAHIFRRLDLPTLGIVIMMKEAFGEMKFSLN